MADRKSYEEEELQEPVSPTGQYFSSSVMSVAVIGVLESEIPIEEDDSLQVKLLQEVFLPINPRFSSIMVKDEKGVKHWKKVEVIPKNHIHVPVFPEGKSIEFYDECFNDYLSNMALQPFPQNQPLWEIHIIKYPTKNAAGNLVFKLHHGLGDGYSLMGALLSCLQRADDPSLPIKFPEFQLDNQNGKNGGDSIFKKVPQIISGIGNTVSDFVWGMLKSTIIEDDKTPIRSAEEWVEFKPMTITTMTFSIDEIKQMKANLNVSVNDVICGVIFLGTRLYMKEMDPEKTNASSSALVLLSTRAIRGYKTVKDMVEPSSKTPWGNHFAFMHVSLPKLTKQEASNPLSFVLEAQKIIKSKRNSAGVLLTGKLLDALRKYSGPEVTAKFIKKTLTNSSMTVSNVFGPVDQLALANHPAKGIYFMMAGSPQNLTITMVSYMRKLRVAIGVEKGLIDASKFKSSIEEAYTAIRNAAAVGSSPVN
ncbi:OLC1v1023947C1 [Oldenlandia corymbosa var. corymbosa]|uniref:OLC1v1023947C1 n=1 Tax=Oldenlandia corymbosa var. corymbosa TaxID=529605 RepID=A0AAV1C3M3_OLDCO|nr:OLC1v1023947C1 [Oldenlandia corymbosa var. corymbosa]